MKKKAIFDVILNTIAMAIPIVLLQLIILPLIAVKMDTDRYGLLLTLVAFISMISSSMGNVVNNTRLLEDGSYKDKPYGDFGIWLILLSICNAAAVIGGYLYYSGGNFGVLDFTFTVVIAVLTLYQEYCIVYFWINLDYKKVLVNNILLGLGYGLGTLLFMATGYWQLIYIAGLVFSIVYIHLRKDVPRENVKRTVNWGKVSSKIIILCICTILAKSLQYIDKLLLYPILGGTSVSIYYASSLVGKIISMVLNPINGVILSHLSKVEKVRKQDCRKIAVGVVVISIFGYFASNILAGPIIHILYPQLEAEVMNYIYIMNMTGIVMGLSTLMAPVLLKFCDIKWQIVINGLSVLAYVALSLLFLESQGLKGFCIGVLLSNVCKVGLMAIVFLIEKNRFIDDKTEKRDKK